MFYGTKRNEPIDPVKEEKQDFNLDNYFLVCLSFYSDSDYVQGLVPEPVKR